MRLRPAPSRLLIQSGSKVLPGPEGTRVSQGSATDANRSTRPKGRVWSSKYEADGVKEYGVEVGTKTALLGTSDALLPLNWHLVMEAQGRTWHIFSLYCVTLDVKEKLKKFHNGRDPKKATGILERPCEFIVLRLADAPEDAVMNEASWPAEPISASKSQYYGP